ncbi:hypothetical protein EJ07DRAFT_150816 [Lizonia empirigonia]|nr:hypothetical protein EJ07DRAFT_150816 [Lizonia empirigonia]
MAEKTSAAVDYRRLSNLRIFARYLAEHPNEGQQRSPKDLAEWRISGDEFDSTLEIPPNKSSSTVRQIWLAVSDLAAFQATFASNPLDKTQRIDLQAAKPKRHANDVLLKTLGSPKYQQGQAGFACFTEAARNIKQKCLLNAVIELFRLFIGSVPHFDTRWVHFHPTSSRESVKKKKCETVVNYPGTVQIRRAKNFAPHFGGLESYVLVSGLTPKPADSDDEAEAEELRWFEVSHDRWELVLRVLEERNRTRERFQAWVKTVSPSWLGKYCPKERYEPSHKRIARGERVRRGRERRSPLRMEITYEGEGP